jgi:hypothetical protein
MLRAWVSVALIVAAAFGQLTAQPQGASGISRRLNDTSTSNRPAASAAGTSATINRNAGADSSRTSKDGADKLRAPAEEKSFWNFSITDLAIALFAFGAIVVGFFQWKAMRASVTEASNAATQQSTDMQAATSEARKAAEAATKAASAAVAVELPVVFVRSINLWEGLHPGVPVSGSPPDLSNIEITFHNYGRTPAFTMALCVEYDVTSELPDEPTYAEAFSTLAAGSVIERDQDVTMTPIPNTIHLTDAELDRLMGRSPDLADLWVYGFLHFRDFMGEFHTTRFCYRWHSNQIGLEVGQRPGFYEDGPPKYISNKRWST